MTLLLIVFAFWMITGTFCLIAGKRQIVRWVGPASVIIGCLAGMAPAWQVFRSGVNANLIIPWSLPFGPISMQLDPLSSFFLIPILLISALSALYGKGYFKDVDGRKNMGAFWFYYLMLTASMMVVVLARNTVLFLLAWEIMSLSSFFLVLLENEKQEVRKAAWIYLAATHVGTAFLLVMFLMFAQKAGSFDFQDFAAAGLAPASASLIFGLSLVGFGTKAGFMPLHIWLPEAHPAAPSPVSAIMSGVMIKTGIYGIIRILTVLPAPPPGWGWTLIIIGAVSGILGVLFALAQHDLKRLLAYHSVENIGIIALGIGVGLLGMTYHNHTMAVLGFAGGILHVLNHALFKSLLFLGAGSVQHATGTRDMDHLGGLLKKMPVTGTTFLVGAIAISGLPPLNGFISEFLIYAGILYGLIGSFCPMACVVAAASLALIGGLALACFTKAFGIVFTGEPRTEHAAHAHESPLNMTAPMCLLALLCLLIGLGAPFVMTSLSQVIAQIAPASDAYTVLLQIQQPLLWIVEIVSAVLGLVMLTASFRIILLHRRSVTRSVTWDCGYAAPSARMQYTSSSFADPLTKFFHIFLGTRSKLVPPKGLFPSDASFSSDTPDMSSEKMIQPVISALAQFLSKFRWIQHGRLNLYILYLAVTLLVILIWKLR